MRSIHYNQICLIANYSEIRSRDDINTNTEFLGRTFKCPVVPANMASVISFDLAKELSEAGYFYILHRFDDYLNIYEWIEANQKLDTISISVGVQPKDFYFIKDLSQDHISVDYITIDVAHSDHILVKEIIEQIKGLSHKKFRPKIIAGNVMTAEACLRLKDWGADAVKVGLSQGKGCSTYTTTGVGAGMWGVVKDCSTFAEDIPIIADGGIREVGDICKSLVAGANMVMIGSEFCKCKDSPAEIQEINYGEELNLKISKSLKVYYGSASVRNKGYNEYIEGFEVRLPMKNETYLEYLFRIEQGIRSCMSYNGSANIRDLKGMKYIIQ